MVLSRGISRHEFHGIYDDDERCPRWEEVNFCRTYLIDLGKLLVYERIIHEDSPPRETAGLIPVASPGDRPPIRVLPGHAFRSMSGGQSHCIIIFSYVDDPPNLYDREGGRRAVIHL